MKRAIVLFMVLGLYATGFAQTSFSSAIEYNDYIIKQQLDIGDMLTKYNGTFEAGTSADRHKALDNLIAQADVSYNNIKAIGGYAGNDSFRKAALDLFSFYKRAFSGDYAQMLVIIDKADITQADLDELDKIVKKVSNEENGLDTKFLAEQEAFAKTHGITLTGSDE